MTKMPSTMLLPKWAERMARDMSDKEEWKARYDSIARGSGFAAQAERIMELEAELAVLRSEHHGTLAQLAGSQRELAAVMSEHTETVAELAALLAQLEAEQ